MAERISITSEEELRARLEGRPGKLCETCLAYRKRWPADQEFATGS